MLSYLEKGRGCLWRFLQLAIERKNLGYRNFLKAINISNKENIWGPYVLLGGSGGMLPQENFEKFRLILVHFYAFLTHFSLIYLSVIN